jgi:tRNA(fMet)-specific endonuclease VapC
MALLFDTDAISQVYKQRPYPSYLRWLATVPRADQYTSAVSIGELFRGAFGSQSPEKHLANLELLILPAITVLPYDVAVARVYGGIHARLSKSGTVLADADLQIAATAIHHGLELVTGNLRHFERVPGLKIHRALIEARSNPS